MRILVITSCTGRKRVTHERQLTIDDFRLGLEHRQNRERELAEFLIPAEELYLGQQHVRLMHGIGQFRAKANQESSLDLWILSAGYGLVRAQQELAPYEATFSGMGARDARAWAEQLDIPRQFRRIVAEPFDAGLLLLGDAYLDVVQLRSDVHFGGPMLVLAGRDAAKRVAGIENAHIVELQKEDTRRFACGLVGLKGEIGGRLVAMVAESAEIDRSLLADTVLAELANRPSMVPKNAKRVRTVTPDPAVDWVIDLPSSWRERRHRQRFRFFIPDWDDRVDPKYDFDREVHAGGAADWSNEVYAHQLYGEPNYDGILVSRATVDESARKRALVYDLGIHRFLRIPREMPVFGDCGAFSYVTADNPPYSTADVLDYYTDLGFDYGVSVDHLLFIGDETERRRRYELTIANAEEFIREHRVRGLNWEPVGAVQGWDPRSYADAAKQYVAMGYSYLAIGGMVRSRDREILAVLEAVHQAVPATVCLHLLGVARLNLLHKLVEFGVTSADSASYLRSAWMSSTANYLTPENGWYTAIRIPSTTGKSMPAGAIREQLLHDRLVDMEERCLRDLRRFVAGTGPVPSELVDDLLRFPLLFKHLTARLRWLAGQRTAPEPALDDAPEADAAMRGRLLRTLDERPWQQCDCPLCRAHGVEMLIFRGNNRNRRRGFHNTHVFYNLIDAGLANSLPSWRQELAPLQQEPHQLALALS